LVFWAQSVAAREKRRKTEKPERLTRESLTRSAGNRTLAARTSHAAVVAAAETRTSPVQMSVIRSMRVVYQNSPKTGRRGIATTLRQLDHDLEESVEGVDGIPVTN